MTAPSDSATRAAPDSWSTRPWAGPAVVGAAVGAGTLGIALWSPTDGGTPLCFSRLVLNVDCPLCGGLRCVGSLAHLDFAAAADHNVLLAVILPLLTLWWAWWMIRGLRGQGPPPLRMTRTAWWGLIGVFTVFGVVRNLPLGPVAEWLAATAS